MYRIHGRRSPPRVGGAALRRRRSHLRKLTACHRGLLKDLRLLSLGTTDGGLYFSDIRPNRIYRLEPNGKIALVREQSNGANGLTLTRDGALRGCIGSLEPSRPLGADVA